MFGTVGPICISLAVSKKVRMQLTISTAISIGLLFPLLAASIFTFLTIWHSGRIATRNAQAQNDLAATNAQRQNDLAAKMKLAEFRQGWINELRNCFAKFELPLTPQLTEMPELHHTATKIRLLMNRKDSNYVRLEALLVRLLGDADEQGRTQAVQEMTPLCQDILKREWEVLKHDLNYNAPVGGATTDAGTF
jgi:hypothetical protein